MKEPIEIEPTPRMSKGTSRRQLLVAGAGIAAASVLPPIGATNVNTQSKPSIVFCHGLWADGSCFSKLIPALRAEGHQVIAAQYGLETPEGDVATAIRTL